MKKSSVYFIVIFPIKEVNKPKKIFVLSCQDCLYKERPNKKYKNHRRILILNSCKHRLPFLAGAFMRLRLAVKSFILC